MYFYSSKIPYKVKRYINSYLLQINVKNEATVSRIKNRKHNKALLNKVSKQWAKKMISILPAIFLPVSPTCINNAKKKKKKSDYYLNSLLS